jgi:type II secretory pathway pseudopilin PulG
MILISMKTPLFALVLGLLPCLTAFANPTTPATPPAKLTVTEIRYLAKLADDEARVSVQLDAEATGIGASSITLLTGDVAVIRDRQNNLLNVVREGDRYLLVAPRAGRYKITLEVIAKIQHADPWNQISFTGPAATIASVFAQAVGTNTEVQLLAGTLLGNFQTNGISSLTGFLGADSVVALRWQSKVAAVARKALLTADSTVAAQATPTVVRYTTKLHYTVVQGATKQLMIALPAAQTLTRLDGNQIRDWHLTPEGDHQALAIEFIKPVETSYDLALYSEQPLNGPAETASLEPPQTADTDRESGSITVFAEDMVVEVATAEALRQENAPDNALVAYHFNARPFSLTVKLKHIEPVISAADRVSARLEETRLVISHSLVLNVDKAGIYTLELVPQSGVAVAEVRGDGVEDWNVHDNKLRLNFSSRVLGQRKIEVQLEQAFKNFPDHVAIAPLHIVGAAAETAQIGAASVPGIRLKTGALSGLREIPVSALALHTDEILAFTADQPDWNVTIGSERLAARIVADVFNLATVADGVVGGSATIRYGLMNQGVQEFQIRVPAEYKNVEFTGPNIRSKEQSGDVWTIGLQDKVWGGYTLVVTYDFQFDSSTTTLPLGGIHAVNVERETGSIAVTTAASLQLTPQATGETLHRVDEAELLPADRALITRAVVFAWQYTSDQYDLKLAVQRFAEVPVLEAVADRTQITSVLTESGEMLTQASFMVKNNEKQFQRFKLPADSHLWSCYVNGLPAKPERDDGWVLVPLPRDANRDQAFAVDIVYAQTNGVLASTFGKKLALNAPRTDIANTYAEWQLFVPPTLRLSGFGGSMGVTQGTTYELFDAWQKFLSFYGDVLREAGGALFVICLLAVLVFALVISAVRRGWNGILTLLGVMAILFILAAMLLPALSAAKRKAQKINSVNNLKQIGLAMRIWSGDNGDRLPTSFEEMTNELGTERITYDPETGQRYVYLGAGMSMDKLKPDSVVCYSAPNERGQCAVLYADGSVSTLTAQGFAELSQRGLVQVTGPQDLAQKQLEQVAQSQFTATTSGAAPPASLVTPINSPPHAPSGVGSIRIELPQTGTPFMFTKVLNIHGDPLSISANVTTLHRFQMIQMLWQSAAFVFGLGVWLIEWRRINRRSFILTLALALMIGSVCSLLVQWRALHDALIIGFPAVVVALVAWLVWKCWPRGSVVMPTENPLRPPHGPGVPPALAAIAAACFFASAAVASASTNTSNAVPLFSAKYSGIVNDRVAEVEATLQFSSVRAGDIVPLFGNDVVVRDFSVKKEAAKLVRDDRGLSVQFQRPGDVVLQVGLLTKVTGDVTKRQLTFAIPPSLSSSVSLTLAEADADVDFPAAVSFKRILSKGKTGVEAVIGSADRIELLWTPRVKHAEEVAATVFCQNAALAIFGDGVMNIRSKLNYRITQGELRQARIEIPDGQKLLRVEGHDVRTWTMKQDQGEEVLTVDLIKGVPSDCQLEVETEEPLSSLPATMSVQLPRVLDVKRESGLIALQSTDELGLSVDSADGLERVDAEEFAQASGDSREKAATVLRFQETKFVLRVRVEAFQPEIEAVAKNNFRIGLEQLSLSASVDYVIKRAGVFKLDLALPADFRVESVGGKDIQPWVEKNNSAIRQLEVSLKERVTGTNTLNLKLVRQFTNLPPKISLEGVHPLGTAKLTGFIAVSTDPGVEAKTDSFDGLTEVPVVSLPDSTTLAGAGSVLAYKYITAEPGVLPSWKLNIAAETVTAWVRAEIVNSFSLTETLLNGRAQLLYNIANAPVKQLRVRVPVGAKDVEISGANLRSREQNGDVWTVELQSPVHGTYSMTVTWDEPRPAKVGVLVLTGASAEGIERESGFLTVTVQPPLQITEAEAANLQRADTSDLPAWAQGNQSATLVYRYVRPGYKLGLDVRRFDAAEVLQTIVDSAKFTSVVAADGQMMTEMLLSVRNNGRQFLEIQLPVSATVCSAFVGAQPVRPSLRDGKILLPIESSSADDGAMPVDVTFVGTNAFPAARGLVGFASPTFDVPVKNAHWEVFLPPDYNYQTMRGGTMTRETAALPEPVSTSFSVLDYSLKEQENKESAKVEVQREVSAARQQLASGNFREANAEFSRAKSQSSIKDGDTDVKKLGEELKSAQASNLINAQKDFYFKNGGQLATEGQPTNAPQQTSSSSDETTAAGEQWTRLQQAQEIVAANVQPLRMNLPMRGEHLAFMQVLQTEVGRPMTFVLNAENTKTVHWPSRLGCCVLAFLALWGCVFILSRVLKNKQLPA